MVERLAEPTVDAGSFVVGHIRTSETASVSLEVTHGSCPGCLLTNVTNVTQLKGTLGAAAGRDHSALIGGARRPAGVALWVSARSDLCHVGPSPHVSPTHSCGVV
jgi:hypothetical protein